MRPMVVFLRAQTRSSITSGTIVGLWTLKVLSGIRTIDTDDLFVTPFGNTGSFFGYAGQILEVSVTTVSNQVSAPATGALLACSFLVVGRYRRTR
jgi:hypothetical protein